MRKITLTLLFITLFCILTMSASASPVISPANAEIAVGNSISFTVSGSGEMLPSHIWTCSNETVGTVDSFGNFIALSPGTANVTAASADDPSYSVSASVVVVVCDPPPTVEPDYTSGEISDPSIVPGDWSGSGIESAPYHITSAEDLALLAERVNAGETYAGEYFLVTEDIDLSEREWTPIGHNSYRSDAGIWVDSAPFCGVFDGGAYNISGLTISDGGQYCGLFGYVSDGAVLTRVQLTDVSISSIVSGGYIGGLVGEVWASDSGSVIIQACSSNANVSSTANGGVIGGNIGGVGGLVGRAGAYGSVTIHDCYSSGRVFTSSDAFVGGLVGSVDPCFSSSVTIQNCYSSGNVSSSFNWWVGGLVGSAERYAGSQLIIRDCVALNPSVGNGNRIIGDDLPVVVLNNYALITMEAGSTDGIDVSPTEAETQSFYEDTLGWDFSSIWAIDPSLSPYPVFIRQTGGLPHEPGKPKEPVAPLRHTNIPEATWTIGSGTAEDPWQIGTAKHLAYLANSVNRGENYADAHFLITEDIDLSSYDWEPIGGFDPGIGVLTTFEGIFDGGGQSINGLTITGTHDYAGLFGYLSNATVRNVHLTDLEISVSMPIDGGAGGLAGTIGNSVTFENCSSSGSVSSFSSNRYVGGLVGYVDVRDSSSVTIHDCFSSGSVSSTEGWNSVGGLVGEVRASDSGSVTIHDCYSSSSVSSTEGGYTGGLIGYVYEHNFGSVTIHDCYSSSNVSSSDYDYVGGLVGLVVAHVSSSVDIQACYSSGNVSSADGDVGGLIGSVYAGDSGSAVTLENSVALNPTVTSTSNAGRVIGCIEGDGTLDITNNYALSTMDASGATDGLDVTPSNAESQSFYEDTLGWDFVNTWTMGSPYPVLRSMPSPGPTPEHGDDKPTMWSGSGTESDPYQISSAEELALLAERVNAGNSYAGKYFLVTEDLDLYGLEWTPIGYGPDAGTWTDFAPFRGIFDGDTRTISGMTIQDDRGHCGLFGYVSDGAVLTGVRLTDVDISSSSSSSPSIGLVGGLVGGVGVSESCSVTIQDCYASGNVSSDAFVGGLVGAVEGAGSVTIQDCCANGSVSSSYGDTGGLVGSVYAYSGSIFTVRDCFATGSVSSLLGEGAAGGLVGTVKAYSGSVTVQNCYASGSVSSHSSYGGVGGLVGYVDADDSGSAVTLENSVALNPTIGTSNIGRLIGYTDGIGTVTIPNTYALSTMSAGGADDGLNVTPSDAATQTFYEDTLGWDFVSVWKMDKTVSKYPILRGTSSSPEQPPEDPEYPELRLRVLSADVESMYSIDGGSVSVNSPVIFLIDADIDPSVYPAPDAQIIFTTPSGGKTTNLGPVSFSDIYLDDRTNARTYDGFYDKDMLELGTYTAKAAFTSPASYTTESNEVTFTLVAPSSPTFTLAGTGNESDPYLIQSAADLVQLGDAVSDGITFENTHFLVTQNLDLSGYDNWRSIGDFHFDLQHQDKESWNTDAYQQNIRVGLRLPFCGIFDGGNHVICGLEQSLLENASHLELTGLFGYINAGAVLKNIRLMDANVSGGMYSGSLIGGIYADNGPVIVENCSVEGHAYTTGGLIGRAYTYQGSVFVRNCSSSVTGQVLGNLIGETDGYSGNITIDRCSAYFPKNLEAGGMVGSLFVTNGTLIVQNCFCEGSGEMTGNLVQSAESSSDGFLLIQNCYAALNSTNRGLISGATTGNDYNSWDSSRTWGKLTIRNSVSLYDAVSGYYAGRVVGNIDQNVTYSNLYALSDMLVNRTNTGYDGLDVSPADAASQTFYEDTLGWDFDTIWKMDKNLSKYPVFIWQQEEPEVLFTVIRDTVASGEWDTDTAAEIVYKVSPAGLASLSAPVISQGNSSLLLTNVTVLKYVGGVSTQVPASVTAGAQVSVTDDISDADYLRVSFHGWCCGDVTGDGKVTSGDAAFIAQHAAKLRQLNETQLFYADVTGDGKATSGDAAFIAQYAAKLRDTHYHLFEV